MRLAEFIRHHMEAILAQWEAFATTLLPAAERLSLATASATTDCDSCRGFALESRRVSDNRVRASRSTNDKSGQASSCLFMSVAAPQHDEPN
jgi:hypothetical protein